MTVLIVGAGAAGLTAAFTLLKQGINDFHILEASNRLGGRLKKLEGFASFPIDLGGEWIHEEPEILEYISQNATILKSIDTILHKPEEYLVWSGPNSGFSLDYIDFALPENFTDYMFVNYTWFDFFNDTIAVPEVRDSIVYDCPVTSIQYSGNNDGADSTKAVTATCKDGVTFEGSHIIVTAPITILKDGDIEFIPQLPEEYAAAINNIPMHTGGYKIFFKFQQDFYPDLFESSRDPIELLFYDETYGENATGENILGVFVAGESADESSQWDDDILVNHTVSLLDEMFDGNASKFLLDSVVQNWAQEPYIRGSYSDWDDTADEIDTLRQPIQGVLYFAGEAIPASDTDYGISMAHGAALSGKEAAESIFHGFKKGGSDNVDGPTDIDPADSPVPLSSSTTLLLGPRTGALAPIFVLLSWLL